MKNITLSADEEAIAKARAKAAVGRTTLNQLFRDWLAGYAEQKPLGEDEIRDFQKQDSDFRVGRMPTRDERNER